nr:unnamed protein product [Callosobruchus analis]
MDKEPFETLLQAVRFKIERKHTQMRKAVSVRERLIVTLRYLATGRNIADLKLSCAIRHSFLEKLLKGEYSFQFLSALFCSPLARNLFFCDHILCRLPDKFLYIFGLVLEKPHISYASLNNPCF